MQQTVLFVDDEPLAIEAVVRSLRSSGLKLLTATSARDGLDLLQEHPVAVVVSDQQMPGMQGHEFLEKVAQVRPSTIRIMLTGQADFGVAQRAINHGHVHQFLVKPCDSPTLLAALHSALDRVELENASRHLLKLARTQRHALDQLEKAHPGITSIARDQDGAIVLGAPECGDVRALIQSMHVAIDRPYPIDVAGASVRTAPSSAGVTQASPRCVEVGSAKPSAESVVVASEEWRSILDAFDDLICLLDSESRVVRVNRALERWGLGDVKFVSGRDLHGVLHETCAQDSCELATWLRNACSTRAPADGSDVTMDDPTTGRSLRASCQKTGVPRGESQAIRYLVILRDVTHVRELERDARRLEIGLQQAQKLEAIGRLAAGVAHEINTPTQFVRDNLEFLGASVGPIARTLDLHGELISAVRAGTADGALAEAHEKARSVADIAFLLEEMPKAGAQALEGIGRIASIVRALKAFSHPGGGERTQVDLAKCIESTITVARNEWKYVAELETDFAADLPMIDGYPGELNQVFLNLIVNSAQAIGEREELARSRGGRIKITGWRDGEFVELRFQDNGPGIPAAIRQRVFEPFFTTKPIGKGTGQGLALARSVVVLKHHGTIDFESVDGQGTTFVLRLPIHAPPIEGEAPAIEGSAAGSVMGDGNPNRAVESGLLVEGK
jgi:signal transduction histidine kinase/CheY-like chemotaxis protein